MSLPKLLNRTLTSLAAIAAVSVIFGAKAYETRHASAETATHIAMIHSGAEETP